MTKRLLVVATADIEADEIRPRIDDRYGTETEVELLRPDNAAGGDPVPAIDDAIERIRADLVVVVTRMSDERSWREAGAVESARDRIPVPVTHLLVA